MAVEAQKIVAKIISQGGGGGKGCNTEGERDLTRHHVFLNGLNSVCFQ